MIIVVTDEAMLHFVVPTFAGGKLVVVRGKTVVGVYCTRYVLRPGSQPDERYDRNG